MFLHTTWSVADKWSNEPGISGRLVAFTQAEQLEIICAAGTQPGDNLWASAGAFTPRFFGKAKGDRLTWRFNLSSPIDTPTLVIRYAYDGPGYRDYARIEPPREWYVYIGTSGPLALKTPHSGGWDEYISVTLDLPPMSAGQQIIRIVSPADHTTTDIDCLGLFEANPNELPTPFRPTIIARAPTGRFLLRATADAKFEPAQSEIFRQFERIYNYMNSTTDWEPTASIGINVIEDSRWPFGGATAYSDMRGVFFRASVMHQAFGDWCHEMSHWFLVGRAPKWLEEPLVKVLTAMVWMPNLYPGPDPKKDPLYAAGEHTGREVLANPTRTYDDIEPVLYAIAVRHGPEVFGRFFKACAKAGSEGKLDFRPGRHLTRDEIVRYLNEAAGQNVLSLLHRWKGFESAP